MVELDESSDGLNDEEKAQMEAIQAKAQARKEEKKIDASPLSIETLRPLLKEMVKQGIADAINPVVDRMERQNRRIQDLRSRVTSIEYVSLIYSLSWLACGV